MNLFKTKLAKRMAIAKTLGFIIGLIAFFCAPMVFGEMNLMMRIGLLCWYMTLGGFVGLFGFMDRHPVFLKWKFPFWFRGIFLGGWMNFVITLFGYPYMKVMMQGTFLEGCSPFWVILEGMVICVIIDYLATKFGGEGKELMKK